MDIGPSFSRAYHLLRERPYLALAPAITTLIVALIIIIFAHGTGAQDVAQELTAHTEAFNAANPLAPAEGGFFERLVAEQQATEAHEKAFTEYLVAQGFDARIAGLLIKENFILGTLAVILIIATLWFGAVITGVLAAQAVRGETWDGAGHHAVRRLLPYAGFVILNMLVFFIPLTILVGLVVIAFVANPLVGALVLLIAIPLALAYIIIIGSRLIFAQAHFFLNETGPVASLQASYDLTRGRFKYAFLVAVIVGAIGFATNTFVNDSIQEAMRQVIAIPFDASVAIALAIGLLFLIIGGVIHVFRILFILSAKDAIETTNHE